MSGVVLGLKGQGHWANKCIFHLFVQSITQKRMIPKCSNLVLGMILRYPRSDMVLGFQGHRLGLRLGYQYSNRRGFKLYECLLV